MGRMIAITIFTVLATAGLHAQVTSAVLTHDVYVEHYDGDAVVSFKVRIGRHAVARTNLLVLSPVLTDGNHAVSFPPVMVSGGKRAAISEKRHNWAVGLSAVPLVFSDDAVHATRGDIVFYRKIVPAQPWMEGADLVLETIEMGCCADARVETIMLVKGIPPRTQEVFADEKMPEIGHEAAVEVPALSTADRLAGSHPYLLADGSAYGAQENTTPATGHTHNDAGIIFRNGSCAVSASVADNERVLGEVISLIARIEGSADSRVTRVSIAGFASPDGPKAANDAIALRRAESVKQYIMERTTLRSGQFMLHNAGEDWEGLRRLVELSDMPHRARVLEIIDTVPVWNGKVGRLGTLMKLEGGEVYRCMAERFFPSLRRAAYIKVYYEIKTGTDENAKNERRECLRPSSQLPATVDRPSVRPRPTK